jgi:hypothetical protein
LRPQPNPANYAELIADIREGKPSAIANFRETFTSGIRFFISRQSHEIDVGKRVEVVVVSVIKEIINGRITDPNLPAQILQLLRASTGLHKLGHPSAKSVSIHQSVADASQLLTDLLNAVSDREREALKRYYVDLEPEKDICAELGFTTIEFSDCKLRLRTEFMKKSRQRTKVSAQPEQKHHRFQP